ncbi:MAG: DNA alkylation repair protein [Spirochaetales bacterium]
MSPTIHNFVTQVREKLKDISNEKVKESAERFFKEEVLLYGVKVPEVEKLAKVYLQDLRRQAKEQVFSLCEELLRSKYVEEAFVACTWCYAFRNHYTPEDFFQFQGWIDRYISNWAVCDTFCNHSVGTLIEQYPALVQNLTEWTKSENRWMRRAAAVSLIVPVKKGKFLEEALALADLLLLDTDDMVQKGYGWLLKVASQPHLEEVYQFVLARKARMPRTALRYAIEKMPGELKKRAMEREKGEK